MTTRVYTDKDRMNFLVRHDVEVRIPLRYGSRAFFSAQVLGDIDDDEYQTALCAQIDDALAKEKKS